MVDDWELQDVWPLTRSSDELQEGYTRSHVQPGGKIVSRRIGRSIYVSLPWVAAMAQVQVVQLGVSDH